MQQYLQNKKNLVQDVFNQVFDKYDLMNDFMSLGIHRLWKKSLINMMSPSNTKSLIDVACGTGDIGKLFLDNTNVNNHITCVDPNKGMITKGKEKLKNYRNINWIISNAENLPVKDNKFDKYKDRPIEQLNYGEIYTGYKGVIWTPLDLPYLNVDLDKMWEVWQKQGQPWFDERPDDMNSARHTDYDKGKLKKVNDHDYRNLILLNAPGSYHSADIKGEWKDFVHDEFS